MESVSHQDLLNSLSTYHDWKHCITEICKIPLTKTYIDSRINELSDKNSSTTKNFIASWGEAHLNKTLAWFLKAQQELS